jgi:GDP-4-dehydro-6-deoxy-D-mannose reductase
VRALVTGADGFAGGWLVRRLQQEGIEVSAFRSDITDAAATQAELASCEADLVFHLAGWANVGSSWTEPHSCFAVNATGTLNVLHGLIATGRRPQVLVVSSAEVYGTVTSADLPLVEDRPVLPGSPYAASKVAAEAIAQQAFLGFQLPVIVVRSFNHIGPGQSDAFVVSALAKRLVDARRSGAVEIPVGNLHALRDYTDVRDVVSAYLALAQRATPGQVYNVCSGFAVSVATIADRLVDLESHMSGGAPIVLRVDPSLQRPVDIPELRGDASRLQADTGWAAEYTLDDTLRSVLNHWRDQSA